VARLWSCGFELNSVTAAVEYDSNTGTAPAISSSVINSGGGLYSLHPSTTAAVTSYITHQFDVGSASHNIFFRSYFRVDTLPDANTTILLARDTGAASTVWSVQITATGTLRLLDDANVVIGTSAAISTATWYRLEVKYVFATAALELQKDGVSLLSGTGSTTSLSANQIRIGRQTAGTAANPSFYFDDVAVNDTTGTAQTGYPGAGYIFHLQPAANGDTVQFATGVGGTGTAPTGNASRVSENTPDDATSYNQDHTLNNLDHFTVSSVPAAMGASDTVNCVSVGVRFAGASGAVADDRIAVQIESQASGTLSTGTTVPAYQTTAFNTNTTATPKNYGLTSYTEPQAGGAWTKTLLGTAQIGYKIVTGASAAARISTVWALVDYTPAAGPTFIAQKNKVALQAVSRAGGY
jgi:hypothetical protein